MLRGGIEMKLKTALQNASKDRNYLLKNHDARLGMSVEFDYADLETLLGNYGQVFATEEDLIEYCIFMDFDIEPIDRTI